MNIKIMQEPDSFRTKAPGCCFEKFLLCDDGTFELTQCNVRSDVTLHVDSMLTRIYLKE